MSFIRSVCVLSAVVILAAGASNVRATSVADSSLDNVSTGVATWTAADPLPTSIVTPSDADWYGGWVANSAASSWIAINPNSTSGNAIDANGNFYTYSTQFVLTGVNLSTVSLNGAWTVDDTGSLYLNGNLIGSLGNGSWGSLNGFSVPLGSAWFNQGINTLSMTMGPYTDNYLEGMNLQGTVYGAAASVVPLPASVWTGLSILALAGCLSLRRRRQVTA